MSGGEKHACSERAGGQCIELVAKPPNVFKVFACRRARCLDLDDDGGTIALFEDQIDLPAVVVTIVTDLDRGVPAGSLPSDLVDDEGLEKPAGRSRGGRSKRNRIYR